MCPSTDTKMKKKNVYRDSILVPPRKIPHHKYHIGMTFPGKYDRFSTYQEAVKNTKLF